VAGVVRVDVDDDLDRSRGLDARCAIAGGG